MNKPAARAVAGTMTAGIIRAILAMPAAGRGGTCGYRAALGSCTLDLAGEISARAGQRPGPAG